MYFSFRNDDICSDGIILELLMYPFLVIYLIYSYVLSVEFLHVFFFFFFVVVVIFASI